MLTYEKSNKFRYFREMSIVWSTRNSNLPVQQILQKKLSDFDELNKFFTNDLLTTYKDLREELTTDETWLFATDDGKLYLPGKFAQNVQRLLKIAGIPTKPSHPDKMSQAQLDALLNLRFSYERPLYQQTLAAAFLGLQAWRPEEVAALIKRDVDLDNQTIMLQDTKSQEPQPVPIHPDLLGPLTAYLSHLKPNEALFIRSTGHQWDRKDVYKAVGKVAKQCNVENINPRRMRSTVGHEMASAGVPMNVITQVLRHSDEATAPRHYTYLQEIAAVRNVFANYRPGTATTENKG